MGVVVVVSFFIFISIRLFYFGFRMLFSRDLVCCIIRV